VLQLTVQLSRSRDQSLPKPGAGHRAPPRAPPRPRGPAHRADGDAQCGFERLFREYGLPQRIRSDNGVPFATQALGRLSSLAVWWIRLGIVPDLTEPGSPHQPPRRTCQR